MSDPHPTRHHRGVRGQGETTPDTMDSMLLTDSISFSVLIVFLCLGLTHRIHILLSDRRKEQAQSAYLRRLFWGDFCLFCGGVLGMLGSPAAALLIIMGVFFYGVVAPIARQAVLAQEAVSEPEEAAPVEQEGVWPPPPHRPEE